MSAIAIVGMACHYPDARDPQELWQLVLAQRRAFRRIPAGRLSSDDYYDADPEAEDRTYSTQAAVIEGYDFDRVRFRVSGTAYRSTDLAHWLALDVADRALTNAGHPGAQGLDAARTAAIVGNTLTGEFSRASVLRLRWPFVRRIAGASMRALDRENAKTSEVLEDMERRYKEPFPPVNEESLAGGLSNTIAGRICNHFDLHGGGYTIDGACSSSLLAIIHACGLLEAGDADAVIAGGVDLSLDPFELVGFAKAGALARDEMRVYDAGSNGFWPGEGAGFVVLRRLRDARRAGDKILAVIRGWGVSSDGAGGLTRPELDGQRLAIERAYRRARVSIAEVPLFEGHGTGTAVGDDVELRAMITALRDAGADRPAVIGSIKANIGHTKAAAGVAGLIKAVMALDQGVLPPLAGLRSPHPVLQENGDVLEVSHEARVWPAGQHRLAGVSAMGFGGINTHVVLEGPRTVRTHLDAHARQLNRSSWSREVIFLSAESAEALADRAEQLATTVDGLSHADLTDLAATLASGRHSQGNRVAIVAGVPAEAARHLREAAGLLRQGGTGSGPDVWIGSGIKRSRVSFLFPGQAAPVRARPGALARLLPRLERDYARLGVGIKPDDIDTRSAQPAITLDSVAALRVLRALGIEADVAIGHSLGELTALFWAGGLSAEALVELARARGQAMAEGDTSGGMASVAGPTQGVSALLRGTRLVIAASNSPEQTVVSGPLIEIHSFIKAASAAGLRAARLPVSHAFHSPLMAAAVPGLAAALERVRIGRPKRQIISTITGRALGSDADVNALLLRQLTEPVRFADAVAAAGPVDLFIEAGPGAILSDLVRDIDPTRSVLSMDAGSEDVGQILRVVAAAFALGRPVRTASVYKERFYRTFDLARPQRFFENPCELAPSAFAQPAAPKRSPAAVVRLPEPSAPMPDAGAILDLVRSAVAARAELPVEAVDPSARLLGDLHLNSLAVAELVAQQCRKFGLPAPLLPTGMAPATVGELAATLADLLASGPSIRDGDQLPTGVDDWVRAFSPNWREVAVPAAVQADGPADWVVAGEASSDLRQSLQQALQSVSGRGTVFFAPDELGQVSAGAVLEGARLGVARGGRIAFVQRRASVAAFARSLHLEHPRISIAAIRHDGDALVQQIVDEIRGLDGFAEVRYTTEGRRLVPFLDLLADSASPGALLIGRSDVLLVTGGARGIGAEAALVLGERSGARVAVLGRADPAESAEVAANLARLQARLGAVTYVRADVTDASSLVSALGTVARELGPVTALLHAAGLNRPVTVSQMSVDDMYEAVAPKVDGLRSLLQLLDQRSSLRTIITFGSVIGRLGLHGEAHYALANEWMRELVEARAGADPALRVLALEWSVWSGVGMGERLGRVEALARAGVTPITVDSGIALLLTLLATTDRPTSVVVAGRLGAATVTDTQPPLLRFLERTRIWYPGVEIVADARVSVGDDPYLADHVLEGTALLPGVIALEAMAQAAVALGSRVERFEQVQFDRPITTTGSAPVVMRVAALRQGADTEVVIRSESTDHQAAHFSARVVASNSDVVDSVTDVGASELVLDGRAVYERLLFHGQRFQRVVGYSSLSAHTCDAVISNPAPSQWFGSFQPSQLVLSDPGARDALIHAIQACLPHQRVLPVAAERIAAARREPHGEIRIHAEERQRAGTDLVWDVIAQDDLGLWERWWGLRLRPVGALTTASVEWEPPLLAVYFERLMEEGGTTDGLLRVELAPGPPRLTSAPGPRPDGRPDPTEGTWVSSASGAGLRLRVTGRNQMGCDLEAVVERPDAQWRDLLGQDRYALAKRLGSERGESTAVAATRVWCAAESIIKAGLSPTTPLRLGDVGTDGAVLMRAGTHPLMTFAGRVRGIADPVVMAAVGGPEK